MKNNFDIYSPTKFSLSESRFSRMCTVDPVLSLVGNQHAVDDDGYLGLSLSQLESLWLAKVLRRMGIESYPVNEKYRSSVISMDEAKSAAHKFILEKRVQRPDYDYGDVEEIPLSWWLSKTAYGFFSRSNKMMREGSSPAGISICIDRATGLIMRERDLINAELLTMLAE